MTGETRGDAPAGDAARRAWPRGRFLGAPLDAPTVAQFGAWLCDAIAAPRPVAGAEGGVDAGAEASAHASADAGTGALVGYQNAWTSTLARREPDLARFFEEATVVYADGMAVVWGARWLGLACPERVNAGDFFVALLGEARTPMRLALVGGAEGLAARAAAACAARLPSGSATWAHHGYLDDAAARDAMIDGLRAFRPDLVLLGMGSPRQERLAMHLRDVARLDAPVVWCVGALFEYVAGERWRAPRWVRRVGMEWFVRLCLEPRRLWRRYLWGNAAFVARVVDWRVRHGRGAGGRAAAGLGGADRGRGAGRAADGD